jgi:hypothetical protein
LRFSNPTAQQRPTANRAFSSFNTITDENHAIDLLRGATMPPLESGFIWQWA